MINAVPKRNPQGRTAQVATIPPPTMGIDSTQAAGQLDPQNCLYTFNMMPSERGMLLRRGYREHAFVEETVPAIQDGIRTIFGYDGAGIGATDKKLYATTAEGIWDVTEFDTTPIQKVVFADTSFDAGYGITMQYIDQAGVDYLWYADSKNGLWEYNGATEVWARPAGISGVDVTKVCFVVTHKQRIWLIETDAAQAWYLPVAAKAGVAVAFYFGSKFSHGGELRGLFNWSVDGGDGVDDYLVAISATGDVIPYRGEDPSTANTWTSVGSYYVGQVPKGRNIAEEYSGELFILSTFGITSMSDLLQGVNNIDRLSSTAYKIAQPLREQMAIQRNEYGWEIEFCPSIGSMVISVPKQASQPNLAFVLNMATQSWGYWRGVPMTTFTDHDGEVRFGDSENWIHVMDVFKDGVMIVAPAEGDNGNPVQFSLLTAYQNYQQPAILKQVQYVRPDFFSSVMPVHTAKALYDYNINELMVAPQPQEAGSDVWDAGLWDSAIWGSGTGTGQFTLSGSGGLGRAVAIALKGEAVQETRLTSFDVIWTAGGPT